MQHLKRCCGSSRVRLQPVVAGCHRRRELAGVLLTLDLEVVDFVDDVVEGLVAEEGLNLGRGGRALGQLVLEIRGALFLSDPRLLKPHFFVNLTSKFRKPNLSLIKSTSKAKTQF